VSSASSFADRLCIFTAGKQKPQISSTDVLSCCSNCGEGCIGGYPHRAFEYMQRYGIVSGGNYTNQIGCKPYVVSFFSFLTNSKRYLHLEIGARGFENSMAWINKN
jgi:cathepsin B